MLLTPTTTASSSSSPPDSYPMDFTHESHPSVSSPPKIHYAPPKTPKKRSRTGCTYCKDKKKKCDEKQPKCSRCADKQQACVYEPVKPRRRRKRAEFLQHLQATQASARVHGSSSSSPDPDDINDNNNDKHGDNNNPCYHANTPVCRKDETGLPLLEDEASRPAPILTTGLPSEDPQPTLGADFIMNHNGARFPPIPLTNVTHFLADSHGPLFSATVDDPLPFDLLLSQTEPSNLFPTTTFPEVYPQWYPAPYPMSLSEMDEDIQLSAPRHATTTTTAADTTDLLTAPQQATENPSPADENQEPDTNRPHANGQNTQVQSTNVPPSDLVTWKSPRSRPSISVHLPSFGGVPGSPHSPLLVDYFCNVLSHLIVLREDKGNPFQDVIVPLCFSSDAAMNAICALSGAHFERKQLPLREQPEVFFHRAICALNRLLNHAEAHATEITATVLLLIYYEALFQKNESNSIRSHLRGAQSLMSLIPPSDYTSMFFERAFRFYDVITALSEGTRPLFPSPQWMRPFPNLGDLLSPTSGHQVDSLLGFATSLWPILYRLSSLYPLKQDLAEALRRREDPEVVAKIRAEFEMATGAVELSLTQWQPDVALTFALSDYAQGGHGKQRAADRDDDDDDGVEDEDEEDEDDIVSRSPAERIRVQSNLNHALAYRHSCLVYLYRDIRELDTFHPLVQRHAHLALTHCRATVTCGGPMGALLWPAFVSACEAVSAEDHELARQVFALLRQQQGMLNIERAWAITQVVWQRTARRGTTSSATPRTKEPTAMQGISSSSSSSSSSAVDSTTLSAEVSTGVAMDAPNRNSSASHHGHDSQGHSSTGHSGVEDTRAGASLTTDLPEDGNYMLVAEDFPSSATAGMRLPPTNPSGSGLWREIGKSLGFAVVFG